MRITNAMMMNNFMGNVNRSLSLLETYQNQLSTGKRITRLSDDPIGIMTSQDAKAKLRKLAIHNTGIADAKSWLTQTETSLREINDMLVMAYGYTVGAVNGTMTPDDRQATAEVVEQIRQHIVQLGNSTHGGRYIFGGYNTTQEPFTCDASGTLLYNGVDLATAPAAVTDALKAQTIEYATGAGVKTAVSLNGVELMGTGADNLNKILSDLVAELRSAAGPAGSFVGQLQAKQQDVLSLLATVGGRVNRLDAMEVANAEDEINYTEVLSRIEDVDQARVTMEFKMAEAVYRSALAVGARVIQPTLMDFLR